MCICDFGQSLFENLFFPPKKMFLLFFFFGFFRERVMERRQKHIHHRETSTCCFLQAPYCRLSPQQACALTRNGISNLFVHGTTLNSLSQNSWGEIFFKWHHFDDNNGNQKTVSIEELGSEGRDKDLKRQWGIKRPPITLPSLVVTKAWLRRLITRKEQNLG